MGAYSLALPAQAHGLPFYISEALSAVDFHTPSGDDITIEERTPGFGWSIAPTGAKVYNPAFDVTPSQLISVIITECGVIYPPPAESLATVRAEVA